jgi:signal transduction histidine kinase
MIRIGVRWSTLRVMRGSRIGLGNLVDVFVALLVVGGQVEAWSGQIQGAHWQVALFSLAQTVPLFFRRRWPVAAPVAVWAAIVGSTYAVEAPGQSLVFFLAAWFALWSSAANNERRRAVGLIALALGASAIAVGNDPTAGAADWLWFNAIGAFAWITGIGLRRRTEHAAALEERAALLERSRDEEARLAVEEERARIARELHDVVAHSVSVMTVQASGVRRLLRPEQERERAALEIVEQTGREALAEMRRLLGVLREAGDEPELAPQPSLDRLEALLEQMRSSGLPVEVVVEGEPRPLAPGIDLSAYRVVQEALTNALKHAGEAHALVRLRYCPDQLELEISDDGRSSGRANGHGQGLYGMRERVAVCGGTIDAGPRPEGGFLVHATLPVEK